MTVLLCQIEPLHQEVVLPVARTLAPRVDLALWLNHRFRDSVPLPPQVPEHRRVWAAWPQRRGFATAAAFLSNLWRIRRFVRKNAVDAVLFVTLVSPLKARLAALLLGRARLFQIVHNGQRYTPGAASQRTLAAFTQNLFLSQALSHQFRALHRNLPDRTVGFFWATNFCDDRAPIDPQDLPASVVRIGVPGSVSPQRRNYRSLFSALEPLASSGAADRLRVYLIGRTPPDVHRHIVDHGLDRIIHVWTDYLPFDQMFVHVRSMDALALLVDETVEFFQYYGKLKQSGSENLALAFRKPVVVSNALPLDPVLDASALRYPGAGIESVLNEIAAGRITRASLAAMVDHTPEDRWVQICRQNEDRLIEALQGDR